MFKNASISSIRHAFKRSGADNIAIKKTTDSKTTDSTAKHLKNSQHAKKVQPIKDNDEAIACMSLDKNAADYCCAYQIQNLSVQYKKKCAVSDVNVIFPEKKITALIGPSGCGKSTFLQSLNRLTDSIDGCQTSGSISLNGRCIKNDYKPLALRRDVGFIFQRPMPFPNSISKNLSIPLKEHGYRNKREIADRIKQALTDVGLWNEVKDRLSHSALDLSGGQQQRLCIARALALQPRVLLMDEPCSALDPIASKVIENLIQTLGETLTIVVVTHNLAQARRIADYTGLFWLQNGAGRLLEFNATEEFFAHPKHPLSKAYLEGKEG